MQRWQRIGGWVTLALALLLLGGVVLDVGQGVASTAEVITRGLLGLGLLALATGELVLPQRRRLALLCFIGAALLMIGSLLVGRTR